jgi:hypothetical protein
VSKHHSFRKYPSPETRDNVRRARRRAALWPAIEAVEPRQMLYTFTNPTLPTIPSTTYNVTVSNSSIDGGAVAVGNGSTSNTTVIQDFINYANSKGGGVVEIPAASGAYMSAELTLESNVNLKVDSGAILRNSSPSNTFITTSTASNEEISGGGIIDGNATSAGSDNMISLQHVTDLEITGVSIENSDHEHLVPENDTNVTINGVTIADPNGYLANADGLDFSGTNFLIENCNIADGDDNIVAKPESVLCSNIQIYNCTLGVGHGLSVGGQTNAGLNEMTVNNITFTNSANGLRLKAGIGSGGLVENITYSNITMTGVQYPILIDSYYDQSNDFPTNPYADTTTSVASLTPTWENIVFENVTSTATTSGYVAAAIYGLPEEPVQNVQFINVHLTAPTGMQIDHARNFTIDANSHITVTSGNGLEGTTSSSYPVPVDAQITLAGYTDTDIGSPTVPFDTSESLYQPDTAIWTINGDGAGIASTSDQFNFNYTPVTGNSNIIAELTGLASPGGSAVPQAGVMYRASTSAGDAFAAVLQTTANQIEFVYRSSSGGSIVASSPVSVSVGSAYLKVVRSGSSFSGWYSTNGGSTYTQIGSTVSISAIPSTALGGLAVSDNSNSKVSAATFANVSSNLISGPSVVNSAAATVSAAGTSITLTALGSDPAGASTLTYTWAATTVPAGVSTPTYDANNVTNAGQSEVATVYGTGMYTFQVTITDPSNLSVTSSVNVTVSQVLTSVMVTPATLSLPVDSTYQFAASALDQFSNTIAGQTFTWAVTGVNNSISSAGLLTLDGPKNRAQVSATDGSVVGTAIVTPLAATATAPAPVTVTPIQTPSPPASGGTTGGGSGLTVPSTPVAAPVTTTTPPVTTTVTAVPITTTPVTPTATTTALPSTTPIATSTAISSGPAVVVAPPNSTTSSTTGTNGASSLQSWLQNHGFHGLATVGWHGIGFTW